MKVAPFSVNMVTNDSGMDYVDALTRRKRTAQLLCLGTALAIFGLFLSLLLLIFSVNCNDSFLMGVKVQTPTEQTMCKQSPVPVITPWQALDAPTLPTSKFVEVSGSSCRTDADCGGVTKEENVTLKAVCVGGADGINEMNYCLTNACRCSTIVKDCKINQKLRFEYMPAQYLLQCMGSACNTQQTLDVPFWKTERRFFLGCERHRKTTLKDVRLMMQKELEKFAAFPILKPEMDGIWLPVQGALARTPDVIFGSFWPSTISESVSNSLSNEAKIFLGFMLCAALCLLKSEYTFEVPSVDLKNLNSPFVLSWNMIRSFFPPMGLILLAMVPMKPTSQIFDLTDAIMTLVHLTGAQFTFVVYLVCEMASLMDEDNISDMRGNERTIRLVITIIGALAMTLFAISYGILTFFNGSLLNPFVMSPFRGTSDWYEVDELDKANLIRPAQGGWRGIKMISYFAEYIVALSILINLAVINYFFYRYTVRPHIKGDEEDHTYEETDDDE